MLKQIIEAAEPLVLTLIGLLFAWLANEIRAKVHSTRAQGILLRLADLAETVTNELTQTVVAELKSDAADGTLSKSDAIDIKAIAVSKVKEHLGPKGVKEALGVFGYKSPAELESLIGSKIESALVQTKQFAPVVEKLSQTIPPDPGV